MLYQLSDLLPYAPWSVFKYVTFRSAGAAVTALLLSLWLGPRVIAWLRELRFRQDYRPKDVSGGKDATAHSADLAKRGTPTMGGILIVLVLDLSVLLPLTRGGLAATAIFCVINSWNELLYGLILTNRNTATLPVAVPSLMTPIGTFWGQIAAVGVVTTLPMLIFALLVQRHIVRGMTGGALAGS